MRKIISFFLIITCFVCYSQTFKATVNSGDHLIGPIDWSRYNTDNLLVETTNKSIRKYYITDNSRNFNSNALHVNNISHDFPQNTEVIVTIIRPRNYWGYSDALLAKVNSGAHLMKATDWSIFNNKDIIVEELDGTNQNYFATENARMSNPNAMFVSGLDEKFNQDTWVFVYAKNADIDQSGNLNLTNTKNLIGAGNNITFYSFSQTEFGPRIRSSLDYAEGQNSKMALVMGSYYNGFKEELTLKNGRIGINNLNPISYFNLFIPYSNEKIEGISVDAQGFGTIQNKNESTYFQVRDLGALSEFPFIIKGNGNVGIGVGTPKNKLDVNGTIHSKEVKVDMDDWADYVFKENYALPTLKEVEQHIKEKGHLSNIPSEKEVIENGLSVGESQKLLLQKIEELTLYIIEQNKRIEKLEKNKTN